MKRHTTERARPHGSRRTFLHIVAFTILACMAAGCNRTSNTSNSNASNSASTANKNTMASNANASSASVLGAATPSAGFKNFIEAVKKNDVDGIKRVMSKSSMDVLSEEAYRSGKSLEDYIKAQNKDSDVTTQEIEVTGEKIDGDTATVDYTQRGQKLKATMVKENGEWKLAYDKMMKQMEEEFGSSKKEGEKK
jgi:hypothetical protein